jgi:hypothetical protein
MEPKGTTSAPAMHCAPAAHSAGRSGTSRSKEWPYSDAHAMDGIRKGLKQAGRGELIPFESTPYATMDLDLNE